MIIEQIDLSLTGEHQSPVLMVEPKLSCDKVVPILVSITESREGRRYCALKHLQFPWLWRQVGSMNFLVFLNLYESFLRRRGDILSVSCLNCSTRLNGYGWLNVVKTNNEKKFGTQNYTCYKCLKHYCGDCRIDGYNSSYFCGECHRRYCDECSPRSEYCDCCENNYCSDCMSMSDCCGILIGGNQCDEKVCSKCRCQNCSRTFCKRRDCDGKRIMSCGRCNGIFCEDCCEDCFNCGTRFCNECTHVFKQTCKICGVKSCSSCVDGEKDTEIHTCNRCGTSYCWYCIVDEADEHELIKDNDCIECVKMIALTLHEKSMTEHSSTGRNISLKLMWV